MYMSGNIAIIELKFEQWCFLDKDVIMEAIITSQAGDVWHSGPTFLSALSKTPNTYSVCLPHPRETVQFF